MSSVAALSDVVLGESELLSKPTSKVKGTSFCLSVSLNLLN